MSEHKPGTYRDPKRFEMAIENFEKQTERKSPPPGAVLGYGSSSIRLWRPHWPEDFEPLTMIGRGFGGSNMFDALHYASRVVVPLRPRAILFYSGDNDLTTDQVAPEGVLATFLQMVKRVGAALPSTRWYLLSIKPSIAAADLWPQVEKTNALLEQACAEQDKLTYLDITAVMRRADGQLRPELFLEDQHHLSRAGYRVWAEAIRPVFVERERLYEPVV